jgi:hypothetical protein
MEFFSQVEILFRIGKKLWCVVPKRTGSKANGRLIRAFDF